MRQMILSLFVGMVLASGSVAAQDIIAQEPMVYFDHSTPLLLLQDGKSTYKLDKNEINKINPEWIDEVQVIKEASETEKYGKVGENGVVILAFKDDIREAKKYLREVRRHNEKTGVPAPSSIIED